MNILKKLKEHHSKVYVSHFRIYNEELYPVSYLRAANKMDLIESGGGAVKVKIVSADGSEKIGYSYCHMDDPFNKNLGNVNAIKNAFSDVTNQWRQKTIIRTIKKHINLAHVKMIESPVYTAI